MEVSISIIGISTPPLYFVAAIKLFLSGLKLAGITGPARDASKRGTKIDIAKSREPRKCRCRILNIMRIPLVLVLAHPFDRTSAPPHPAAHRRSDPRVFFAILDKARTLGENGTR